ncbi:Flp pilus assembly complex ATPase component TadA [bacterium]|nr:Flp pilus assembly complex ATPase component TadA [bacterium]
MAKKLGEILVEAMVITPEQLQQALEIQKRKGGKLGEILIELGLLNEKIIADIVSLQRNIKRINLDINQIDPAVLNLIPKDVCIKYRVLPYAVENNTLLVAMDDPLNQEAINMAQFSANMRVEPGIVEPSKLDEALARLSNAEEILPTQVEEKYNAPIETTETRVVGYDETQGSIVKLVNMILIKGIELGASDIHIEADAKHTRVRYRINGVLHEKFRVPVAYHEKIVLRIKVLSKMDISVHDVPQTGGFRVNHNNGMITMRVETLPTIHGENVSIRFATRKNETSSLEKLGLSRPELGIIAENIFKPAGLIIVCGPTGSGKTTTLYAILRRINSPEKKIVTLEDPVEEILPLINQVQIDTSKGLTFARALRSILRMDPDIIFVGEIRDKETAQIAVRAAITGHLVLTTLHTRNSFEAIYRLIDLGVEPFLLVNTINLIIAQRLVRTLCSHCKVKTESGGRIIYRPQGCDKCNDTGYIGRTGVFELLPGEFISRDTIIPVPSMEELARKAKSAGINTLWQKGLKKVYAGETSLSEVIRAIPKMSWDEDVPMAI